MGRLKKKSFVFNIEWHEVLMDYPSEVRLEVYDAIIEYAATGTLLELKPMAKMAFSFIKKEIDFENQKTAETSSKRSEAGKTGMNNRYQTVTNLTNGNKSNKCYQDVTNLTNDNNAKNAESINISNILDNNLDNNSEDLLEENNNSLSPLPSPSQAKKDEWDEEFERFWDMYGKKVGDKSKIQAKFLRLPQAVRLQIFRTLPAYIESTPDKKFRKNPETYLNNKSWNDEIINDNGSRQTQNPAFRQSADLSQFRDSSRHYETISDF